MAPSQQEIASIFEKIGPSGGNFMDHADPDVHSHVMGHEHQHKRSHQSHKSMSEEFFGQFEWVDWDTIEIKARQIIGGGSTPWASVELTSIGKSKKSKRRPDLQRLYVLLTGFG